jgi:hypothetical protein
LSRREEKKNRGQGKTNMIIRGESIYNNITIFIVENKMDYR